MLNRDCRPTTLRAVIEAIQSNEGLPNGRKTELMTGIKTFCRCVARDPSEIDANPAALRALSRHAKPQMLPISDAHFRNTMSRLRKALEHVGIPVDRRRNMPLSPAWEARLNKAGKKRIDLRKFAGHCSARGIEPQNVTQETFDSYYEYLGEQSIEENFLERGHRARRGWNDAIAVEGSGYVHIENVFDRGEKLPSLTEFPAAFQAQLQGYKDALVKPKMFASAATSPAAASPRGGLMHRLSAARRKPLSPVTADGYARSLLLLAGYLVREGMPVEQFASLNVLLDPGLVVRGLERIQTDVLAKRAGHPCKGSTRGEAAAQHDPNVPLPIVTAVAYAVLSLAKYLKPDAETFATIQSIASSTRVRRKGMTAKNKARLNQLADPRAKALLLNLPAKVFARYGDVTKPTFKQAREVQDACILAVLLELPLRMKNVAYLDLERHFQRPVGNLPGKWLVSILGHEVKNNQDINGEFTEETSAMLERYVRVFRPVQAAQPSSVLFVSRTGNAKRRTTTSTQFRKFIRRETGLQLHAHIMRHFAATNWLDAHPDDAETARQLLGHQSIDTTRNSYVAVNERRAFRRYHGVLDSMRAASAEAPRRTFDFSRRTRGGAK
jgi:integrase